MRHFIVPLVLIAAPLLAQGTDTLTRMPVMQAGAPMKMDSASPVASWDMDVKSYELQDRVQYYVNLFSGKARERITERLDRGSRFETMIRSQLRAGGVPEDMYYLALIESGFDPNAYSKAAAVGMWQFMTSTAKGMGMRVDWWIDERRDPVRSTSAAARFLGDLQTQFKSLYLAAAAYNGGPGRVSRGMKKYADDIDPANAEDAFFLLADKNLFKRETKDYVPQLIASALIAKEPAKYGMELHRQDDFIYDSVRVGPSIPLAAVAKASGSTVATIVELNPHVLRGMTAPKDSMYLRIPTGSALVFDSALAGLSKPELLAVRRIESRKGDTPVNVARSGGISLDALKTFNPKMRRLKSGALAPGQALLVPTAAVADAARNVPDPAIEKYPKRGSTKARPASKAKGKSAKAKAGAKGKTPVKKKKVTKAK